MSRLLVTILLSILLLLGITCYGECTRKMERVAVIDTGLDLTDPRFSSLLCKDGNHWDFVLKKPVQSDYNGHGTHVAGLIKKYAGNASYCFLIYRYFEYDIFSGNDNLKNEIQAIKQAVKDGATIINISGGGRDRSYEECKTIENASSVRFVLAAGNNGENIDFGHFYPACCGSSNITIVGSTNKDGVKLSSSNYGNSVTAWELGLNVESTVPGGTGVMSGTSQATAITTGKIVSKNKNQCHIGKQ